MKHVRVEVPTIDAVVVDAGEVTVYLAKNAVKASPFYGAAMIREATDAIAREKNDRAIRAAVDARVPHGAYTLNVTTSDGKPYDHGYRFCSV